MGFIISEFSHQSYIFNFFQAFVNLVLTLCDAGDSVVMFTPYYFNAYMSFQMTGVTDILVGPNDPETLQPDAGTVLSLSTQIYTENTKIWRSFLFLQVTTSFVRVSPTSPGQP
jgi:hypothetical protein